MQSVCHRETVQIGVIRYSVSHPPREKNRQAVGKSFVKEGGKMSKPALADREKKEGGSGVKKLTGGENGQMAEGKTRWGGKKEVLKSYQLTQKKRNIAIGDGWRKPIGRRKRLTPEGKQV